MAAVREEFVLVDRFSAPLDRLLGLYARAAGAGRTAADAQRQFEDAAREASAAVDQMAGAAADAASAQEQLDEVMARATSSTGDMGNSASKASRDQDKMNRSMQAGQKEAAGLERRLLSLAQAYIGLRTARAIIDLSDTMTQTTARLDRMNDGLRTTGELQDMIYQAAQRSRGDYQETADMVAKLGTMAGGAFASNAELVAFAEQINKQFKLAGTSAQGAQAAMLQLTQAMSSGVLRGEELNSVLEQAPTIAQAIAKYMDVNIGEMRELASEGKITAQVVKEAMFAAAAETNTAFESIPLTFEQVWTMAGNTAVKSFEPALKKLNDLLNSDIGIKTVNGLIGAIGLLAGAAEGTIDLLEQGAQLVADNWDIVQAILAGVAAAAAAAGINMTRSAVMSAAAWAAANPVLLLIAGSVALIIYMARQMGATWEEIGGVVGGVFGLMYAAAVNIFIVPAQNIFAAFANFVGNFLNDPVNAVKILVLDMATWVLDKLAWVIHGIEDLINAVPFLEVSFSSNIDAIYNKVKQAAQDAKNESEWKEYVRAWDPIDVQEAWAKGSELGRGAGAALDRFDVNGLLGGFSAGGIGDTDFGAMLDASGIPDNLASIGADTAAIKRSVSLSEEDMKLLVDMAERRYINNIHLTAQTPVITINGQNTGDSPEDLRWLEEALKKILLEQSASHTDLSYT